MSSKNMKQQELGNSTTEVRGPIEAASRKTGTKKPATRVGTLEDWRVGGKRTGENSGARGKRLRDGR